MDNHSHTTTSLDHSRRPDAAQFENVQPWDRHQLTSRPMSGHHKSGLDGTAGQYRDYSRQDSLISPSAITKEEQSDSDVSDTPIHPHMREKFRFRPENVVSIAQLPPRPSAESVEAHQTYLSHVEKAENVNETLKRDLEAKRKRKDNRVRDRRAVEDQKIEALYEARKRHDQRVMIRRAREDDALARVFRELDQVDETTRARIKRLKRGLPPDDNPEDIRNFSASSSSPLVTSHSASMPPAKRHQPGPPGPPDHTYSAHHARPPINGTPSVIPSSSGPPHLPSYSFYGSNPPNQPSYQPYPQYSNYGGPPPAAGQAPSPVAAPNSSSGTPALPVRNPQLQREVSSPTINGHVSSTSGTPSHQPQSMHTASPTNAVNRPLGKEYNTRPPDPRPTSTTGFASINMPAAPPTSGFAAINPRGPHSLASYANQMTPVSKTPTESNKGVDTDHAKGSGRDHANDGVSLSTPVSSGGKRTPSTTHPYSQSEAFANRHHHSERVDSLGRGIWTSHGQNGTREIPTGPPVEMYLRCNHDGCMRIDWRTVHGLQCHIVKSHEQPKGTIGSLEKALDRYGVPVSEVEAFEKDNGMGSAGTMADPKNQKIKNKTREMQQRTSVGLTASPTDSGAIRRPYSFHDISTSPPPAPPTQSAPPIPNPKPQGIGFRPGAMPLGSPMFPSNLHNRKSNEGFASRSRSSGHSDEDEHEQPKHDYKPPPPLSRFGIAKAGWGRVEDSPSAADNMDLDKKVPRREDAEMYDAPPLEAKSAETKESAPNTNERESSPAILPTIVATAIQLDAQPASTTIADPAPSTTTSVPPDTASQAEAAETEKTEKKPEAEASSAGPMLQEPQTEVASKDEGLALKQNGVAEEKAEEKDKPAAEETIEANGVEKDEVKEDHEMTEEPASVAPASPPPPQPAAPAAAVASPKSTRKSTSRRASASVYKMEVDGDGGSDDEASRGDDGSRDDGKEDGVGKEDGDTITSMGKGERERSTRSKRNANGRFAGKGGRWRSTR